MVVLREPFANLETSNKGCARVKGDRGHVGHVVEMTMGNKNMRGGDRFCILRRGRVRFEERIDEQGMFACFNTPTTVTVPGYFWHSVIAPEVDSCFVYSPLRLAAHRD